MIDLRPAEPRDAEAVARIYIRAWNDGFGHLLGVREFTPETVDRWRHDLDDGPAQFTVAEIDGNMVGIVGVGPSRDPIDPSLGELDTIAVEPDSWRIGVGRRLMGSALETLGRSWTKAILCTPANYERGHAFYMATGWVPLALTRTAPRLRSAETCSDRRRIPVQKEQPASGTFVHKVSRSPLRERRSER